MNKTELSKLEHEIIHIVANLCAVSADEIKGEDRLREDLGMDSVSSMELLSMLAENMDLEIEMEEAISVTTVAGIVEMARSHLDGNVVS